MSLDWFFVVKIVATKSQLLGRSAAKPYGREWCLELTLSRDLAYVLLGRTRDQNKWNYMCRLPGPWE